MAAPLPPSLWKAKDIVCCAKTSKKNKTIFSPAIYDDILKLSFSVGPTIMQRTIICKVLCVKLSTLELKYFCISHGDKRAFSI